MEDYQTLQKSIIQLGKRLMETAENTEPTDNGRALQTLLDNGEREWLKLWEKFVPTDEPKKIEQSMTEFFSHLDWIAQQGAICGARTGFDKLDRLTGGLQRGELIVLSSPALVGKTSLAMNISTHIMLEAENPVLILGDEWYWVSTMLAHLANVDQSCLAMGKFDNDEIARLSHTISFLQEQNNLYFHNAKWDSANQIRRMARNAYQRKQGLSLIVIDDFDQLVQDSVLSPAEITAQIKALAKELLVPIIVVVNQIPAWEREEKRPTLEDLPECYQFRHYADVILMLYRDELYHADSEMGDIAELFVRQKHREDGYLTLKFAGNYARFSAS